MNHREGPKAAGWRRHRVGWHLEGSKLASPFRPGPGEEVVARYRDHQLSRPDLPALRGRRLGCWCVPEPCHAQVIAELADNGP